MIDLDTKESISTVIFSYIIGMIVFIIFMAFAGSIFEGMEKNEREKRNLRIKKFIEIRFLEVQ